MKKNIRFGFGKNWLDFIQKNFEGEKVQIAKGHILSFMEKENLNGLTFLDIGCGSGIHSIAALDAGAASVHGFDYDQNSVLATKWIQNQIGCPKNWTVEQGSVLDSEYLSKLPEYDLVYSWGVLHHTGEVWTAIENAAAKVKTGGQFYIALYSSDAPMYETPEFWLNVKRRYVSSGWVVRRLMDLWYVWRFDMQKDLKNFSSFRVKMREYKHKRGMSVFTDIRDWLGGWPMEFVGDQETINFCESLGLKLEKIKTGEACTEFLFKK
jgi:2-polyprenyl-3-methyl-5-hydroxy-6-metoxy-1,4-benzoquinol methylase